MQPSRHLPHVINESFALIAGDLDIVYFFTVGNRTSDTSRVELNEYDPKTTAQELIFDLTIADLASQFLLSRAGDDEHE